MLVDSGRANPCFSLLLRDFDHADPESTSVHPNWSLLLPALPNSQLLLPRRFYPVTQHLEPGLCLALGTSGNSELGTKNQQVAGIMGRGKAEITEGGLDSDEGTQTAWPGDFSPFPMVATGDLSSLTQLLNLTPSIEWGHPQSMKVRL